MYLNHQPCTSTCTIKCVSPSNLPQPYTKSYIVYDIINEFPQPYAKDMCQMCPKNISRSQEKYLYQFNISSIIRQSSINHVPQICVICLKKIPWTMCQNIQDMPLIMNHNHTKLDTKITNNPSNQYAIKSSRCPLTTRHASCMYHTIVKHKKQSHKLTSGFATYLTLCKTNL